MSASTVLITGASSGFGLASARLFASRGWNVIASMRTPSADTGLAALPNVLVVRLDVQDPDSITTAIEAGIARFGAIDALVNNAGFGLFGIFESTPPEKIREQFEVNVFGAMEVTRAILPHFRARRAGTIVNISSGAGVFGLPMLSLYNASKFALEGFSESLSYELRPLGIDVRIVEPGGVLDTGFGGRSAQEADAGGAPASDYASFVAHSATVFQGLSKNAHSTAQDVAEVIHRATVETGPRLRYLATEDIAPLVAARRETSEEHYWAFMRARFGQAAHA